MNDVAGIVPGNKDKRHSAKMAYDLRSGRFSLGATASYIHGNISLPQTAMGRYDAIWNLMINQTPWPYVDEARGEHRAGPTETTVSSVTYV